MHVCKKVAPEDHSVLAHQLLLKCVIAMVTEEIPGLFRAYLLNGEGEGTALSWEQVNEWTPQAGLLWVHLDVESSEVRDWLRERSGLTRAACSGLLAGETRPLSRPMNDGLLVILRGINHNPGADPEDMVSLRLWVDTTRVLSLSRRRVMAVSDLADEIEEGVGPLSSPEILTTLTGHLLDRLTPTLDELGDAVDLQEEKAFTEAPSELQGDLAELRRQVIALRRHLAPQREVMVQLVQCTHTRFDDKHSAVVQLLADELSRHVEDLDELRERSAVTHDLIAGRQSDLMNRQMLMLSLVTAIFLPLGLITGLLGINVKGVPGAENEWGFFWVCAILALLAGLLLAFMRKKKWF